MYFESRVHKVKQFQSVTDVAKAIINREVSSSDALQVGDFFFLSDSHIDDLVFSETALVQKQPDGTFRQIESITIYPKSTVENLETVFIESITPPLLNMGKTDIQFDQPRDGAKARFTCGCCGERFTGIIAEQLKFDQDDGYGICSGCADWYK